MLGERLVVANKKARKVFLKYHSITPEEAKKDPHYKDVDGMVGVYRKTKVFCSSPVCCGNPRGSGERTFRERKFYDDYEYRETING